MSKLFKILPMIAIVVGIGGAWASQAEESPCRVDGTPGYGTPLDMDAPPDAPSNSGIAELGEFNSSFTCSGNENTCHYVYESPEPGQPKEWIECPGQFVKLPN